jgi:hypothetical protein
MRGGDAFNMVPAKNIYPLNNYAIDTQRMMRGGNKSRKYMYSGGSAPSWFTTTTNTQPIASLWGTNNRFYV